MNQEILDRLEWHDGGDGINYEYWSDPQTGKIYLIEMEIVRDFDSAKEVDRITKF